MPQQSAIESADAFWAGEGVGTDPDDLVVTYIGSISHQFEFEPILQAARRLNGVAKVTFVICGTGDRLEQFRRQTQSLSNVMWPGWVSLPLSWTLLKRSLIGLVPLNSTPDFLMSIPNKVAEYLAAGLPVAASFRTGLVRDLLEGSECGFSYEQSGDVLARKLSDLGRDRAVLARMSRNAASLYEERFRADRIYPEFVSYLETVQASYHPQPTVEPSLPLL